MLGRRRACLGETRLRRPILELRLQLRGALLDRQLGLRCTAVRTTQASCWALHGAFQALCRRHNADLVETKS